jgi:transcriptional regulator with XRE-family HTH domain
MESFNQRLKRIREEKNLSASEMARLINVAQTTYRQWEYGRGMKFPPFLKISQVLAISVTELITGEKLIPHEIAQELRLIEEKLRELRLKLEAMR